MTETPPPTGWRSIIRGNVLMMGLVSFFTDASSELIYPLLPVFLTGLVPIGTAAIYLGLMEGVAESVASLLKIVSGRWSDRLGKRKLPTVIGYGISTAARPAMALAGLGWHVVFLRFLDRIGKGVRTAPRDALISDSVDRTVRGRAFSFHRAMDNLGAVVGPLLAAVVLYLFLGHALWQGHTETATPAELHALRWLFALALVPGILAFFTLTAGVREIPPAPRAGGLAGAPPPRLPGRFYAFLVTVTVFTLGNSSDLFLVFYGKTRFDLGLLQLIGLWIVLHLSKVTFSLPGGALADRYGRPVTIIAGWAIYTGVYVGMAFVHAPWLFWTLIVVYGAYYGLTEGAEKALVADYVPSADRGRAYGLYHGAVGLAALPASLVFGIFWAQLGPRAAFLIGAGLAGLATLLLAGLLATSRRQPPQ